MIAPPIHNVNYAGSSPLQSNADLYQPLQKIDDELVAAITGLDAATPERSFATPEAIMEWLDRE